MTLATVAFQRFEGQMASGDRTLGFNSAQNYHMSIDGGQVLTDEMVQDILNGMYGELVEASGDRPDADGYIDFAEATTQWRFGKGQPLYADANKLDWGKFSMSRFDNTKLTYQGYPLVYVQFAGSDYVNKTQALVYGSLGLVKVSDDSFYVLPDQYDFDIKFQPGSFLRDQYTNASGIFSGPGTPFTIYFYGIVKPGR
jgi:hypothetical protein